MEYLILDNKKKEESICIITVEDQHVDAQTNGQCLTTHIQTIKTTITLLS